MLHYKSEDHNDLEGDQVVEQICLHQHNQTQ